MRFFVHLGIGDPPQVPSTVALTLSHCIFSSFGYLPYYDVLLSELDFETVHFAIDPSPLGEVCFDLAAAQSTFESVDFGEPALH